ncbi:FUSC family protein [Kaistia adipata]|uniref:FUSC family protein n=1 Tax=Kaistia adipata TaxID=166954 RepID=UPI0009FF8D88|nr:FUSC family protein [Kaistia adipata]
MARTSSRAPPGALGWPPWRCRAARRGRHRWRSWIVPGGAFSRLPGAPACLARWRRWSGAGSHAGWLPAAALRVLKPTRGETLSRMKQRGIGSLLGAAAGGLLLGFSGAAWLHALIVGGLVFAMLVIGAKRYGAWTFCLTAVALAFDLGPAADPVPMALDRVLLTAGGLLVATAVFALLPGQEGSPSADRRSGTESLDRAS